MIRHLLTSAVIVATLLLGSCGSGQQVDLAIVQANLVDVVAGVVIPDQTVLIRRDRIVEVGTSREVAVPAGANVVDAAGRYLIPGLWDMHVHALWDEEVARVFLPLFVVNGVTGVRDMGGSAAVRDRFRALAETGESLSPRIVASGPFVDGIDFYPGMTIVATDSSAGRAAVDSVVASGGDFVKVYTQLPRDAFLALLDRARELGIDVVGHVPAEISSAEAAEKGFRSIEHLRDEIEPLCRPGGNCNELFHIFRENGTWQTPTLVVLRAKASLLDSSIVFDERHRYAPSLVRNEWAASRESKMGNSPEYFEEKRDRFRDEMWLVGEMHGAGVPILAGSDAGSLYSLPGFGLHDELELLADAGMSEADVLRSATIHPAEFLGLADTLGTIGVGKIADMVLLKKNPLENNRNLQSIEAVFLRGSLLDRDDLDRLLLMAEPDATF